MTRNDFIRRVEESKPFTAADGATVYELFNPSRSAIKNLSLASGFLETGKDARAHFHKKSEEIYYVLSGQGQIRLGEKKFSISRGDAIFVPVNTAHALANTSQTESLTVLAIESPPYQDNDLFFINE